MSSCKYCGGNCENEPKDSEHLCDGFAGDIDGLYKVPYTFSDHERNIIRMALIYLKADCDSADLEDLSTDEKTLEEDITKLIDELTPASWDDDPPPTKGEIKEMQKRREDTGEDLRLFRG